MTAIIVFSALALDIIFGEPIGGTPTVLLRYTETDEQRAWLRLGLPGDDLPRLKSAFANI